MTAWRVGEKWVKYHQILLKVIWLKYSYLNDLKGFGGDEDADNLVTRVI